MELIELTISAALLGLIWLIQLTHYPSFRYVDTSLWKEFHKHHTRSISIIVIPLMLLELALAFYGLGSGPKIGRWVVLILVLGVWANTFLQALPLHNALAERKDDKKIDRLVRVNWLRTLLWTVKLVMLIVLYFYSF